jgi:hypothetical protein
MLAVLHFKEKIMSKKQIISIGIVVVLIATYLGIKLYASNVAEGNVNKAITRASSFADIDYKKVSVDLLTMDVRISDILVSLKDSREKIKIDEITIHDIDDKSDIPTFLSISCEGIEIDLHNLADDSDIKALGYHERMMINLNVDYAYNKEKNELDIKDIRLGADEAGTLSVSFHLGNINLKPEGIIGAFFTFPHIIFHEAKIKYEDDSLVERLIQLGAQRKQTSVKDFKESLMRQVEKEIEKEKDDFIKEALVEIKKFLEDPDEFTISASPSKPHPLGRIMRVNDPKDVIKLLNITLLQKRF